MTVKIKEPFPDSGREDFGVLNEGDEDYRDSNTSF